MNYLSLTELMNVELDLRALEYRMNSVANSTRKARYSQWTRYLQACDEFNWMVSDSSLKGFAVYLGHDWVAGTWNDSEHIPLTTKCCLVGYHPIWDKFDPSNINELELWPIVVGLKRWAVLLRDQSLNVFTDNTQVMFMLINANSINPTCRSWLKEIYWLCAVYNITLCPKYISTKSNLVADTLSRLPYYQTNSKLKEYLTGSDLCCLYELFVAYRIDEC